MPQHVDTWLRIGRTRMRLVHAVSAISTWVLPVSGVVACVALAQRLGWMPVNWIWVGSLAAAGLGALSIMTARQSRTTMADAARALDEGLDLDDRLATALTSHGRDDPAAKLATAQAEQLAQTRLSRGHVRRALPLRWHRSAPWAALCLMFAVLVAGPPAAQAAAASSRVAAQAQLDVLAQSIDPMQIDDPAVAEALEALQTPLPELQNADEVEMEALQRITDLLDALDAVESSESALAAAHATDALRGLEPSDLSDPDVAALRDALARGDFETAGEALQSLADQTSTQAPSASRQAALDRLAREIDMAAVRAAMAERDSASPSDAAGAKSAKQALEELAKDLRDCQKGSCDQPGGACDRLSEGQKAGKCAGDGKAQCASAAAACNGSNGAPGGPGDRTQWGGQVGEDSAVPVDAGTVGMPQGATDSSAAITDVESAPGQGEATPVAPIAPVGVGRSDVPDRGPPSPEDLRRLPNRYQDAVRRFFLMDQAASTDAAKTAEDDE
ncbi:MAG: hypothetical protein MK074_06900 [Phycisphaerales bacterium]|nr:hypothetical protein [Phycisphaerales bacterium]